ncbi:c-type cytochrome [Pontibacillus yanchengensis]|uniref:C-type cytochrome n=1 Tax=Pontibacillus yanchengensis TaxID=462910 RepID=A0ACC7VLS7_9BACI|nr:c-type cytochrome [Pontibacillus yanchengensis]
MHRGKGMKFVGDSRVPAEKKPNIPKDYSEYPGRTEAFWPNFLLKEWLVGAVFLIGFLTLTVVAPSPLEKMADPTDAGYIPLPDWYFLFLYQFLKYEFASGPYIVLGAFIIPGLAFGALLLAPFLDAGPGRRPFQRPISNALMLIGLAATVFLTWEAADHVDWEARAESGKITKDVEINTQAEGYQIFKQNCASCHGQELGGGVGPSLVGTELSVDKIKEIAINGKGDMPAVMKGKPEEQIQTLAEFVKNPAGGGEGGSEGGSSDGSSEGGSEGDSEDGSEGDSQGGSEGESEGNSGDTASINTEAAGYEIFKQNCASCHGQELGGGAGPNLVNSKLSQDEIKQIVTNGKGSMPAVMKGKPEGDINKLTEFVANPTNGG